MAARAIWKGVIRFGSASVPIKLYSAVEDHSIHFRLLHEKDLAPVKQKMVDSASGETVEYADARKAYPVSRNRYVILEKEDLEELEPEESRDIEVTRFVDPAEIDHRWYERAYYLGPDGGNGPYFALAQALEKQGKEGVARWTMRKKSYVGSLRAAGGYLMLIVLRHADEVIVAEDLPAPAGRSLNKREVEMAGQLVEALSGEFDPAEFSDEYRERVLELVETKASGGTVKLKKFRPRKEADESLDEVLAASLKGLKKRA
jgi:DNA end-binding protein Ku